MLIMRTTLDLPDPLFRELKTESARRGLKLKELLATFVEAGLQQPSTDSSEAARKRSPLPAARRASGSTIPAIDNQEIARIFDEEDAP